MRTKKDQIKEAAETNLETFIRIIMPNRVLGSIHCEVISWLTREDAKSHRLLLMPRDHQKSFIAAAYCVWLITRNPAIRILYISSTSNLATKQLKLIKDILTSDRYRFYWPEMVNEDEGRRTKWTETEIAVDHPLRKVEFIRDPTVYAAGLNTNTTGMHADETVFDDVVIMENAYTEDAREKTRQQVSLLASVESTTSRQLVVGTRYHPQDVYSDMLKMRIEVWNDDGSMNEDLSGDLYESKQFQVEDRGDGTGQFLWPVQYRNDGKPFGFNQQILARKKAQYLDRIQFRAQYYNDPNDYENAGITRECFQYYDKRYLTKEQGHWFFKGKRLNTFAAMDFAYSLSKRSDFTAIVVVGVDGSGDYYVLDVDRFKTDKISDYYTHILSIHQKWDVRKLLAECTAAQSVIVTDLKHNYIRPNGLALSIEDRKPTRHEGDKEERIEAVLQPRYENRQIWHYQGGNCQTLEDELILKKPPHDDCKDALAYAIEACVIPTMSRRSSMGTSKNVVSHPRFGGYGL